ncbi:MAG: HAMP domain-containing protein [Holosporales bacterium]|jgi:two-component system nitrogen regulation sensor histidine kinase NtrY|nr:HAMP domain-containing protein [Holosporales bacterium]
MVSFRRNKKLLNYILGILVILFGLGTYYILISTDNISKSYFLIIFLYIDILLLFFLIFSIGKQIIRILKIRNKTKLAKSKFQKQIILLFSCVTVVPATCVFIFSIIFFNIGIESLFKAPVKAVIENANQVSNIYINETKKALENYAYGVGMQLKGVISDIMISKSNIEEILNNETLGLGIDAIVFQATKGGGKFIIAKSLFTLSLQFEEMQKDPLNLVNKGEEGCSWESKQSVIAVQAIDAQSEIYLMVSKNIDQKILDHKHKIINAINEYTSIATQRTGLKLTFITFFSTTMILLLMIVILTGITFANRIVKPVNKLIYAAKNVSLGNYNSLIVTRKFKNELDILISSFNTMLMKLEEQKKELIISNKQNAWRDIARKIAHEIKNPLTPIQLSAERLRKKYQEEIKTDRDTFETCIDTIIRQVNCIGSLVNEFSDFARMPSPKIEEIDVMKLVRETALLQSNSHKNINFNVTSKNTSYICLIDPQQINQVLINLLQNSINAINDNKKHGNIYIEVGDSKDAIKDCIIEIEDDGPGFSDHSMEHAMDPYYTTRESGNGLGLPIVYKILTEHNGKIEIGNSIKHGGASIIISIPLVVRGNHSNKEVL